MRLLLPTFFLPDDLVSLFKMNISPHHASEEHPVVRVISSNKSLYTIIEKSLKDGKEQKIGVSQVFNGLGWGQFKYRWISLYVHKFIYGKYTGELDMSLVNDLISFEERFSSLQKLDNSRLLLFGFYLKMINMEHRKNNVEIEEIYWEIPEVLDNLILQKSFRTDKPDWLLLSLWQYAHFLGTDKLLQIAKEEKPYDMMFAYLTEPQRYQFLNNLLAYGSSINEQEIFTAKNT